MVDFRKGEYLLTTKMRCIRVHALNVLPLFMKFGGPQKCVCGGGYIFLILLFYRI